MLEYRLGNSEAFEMLYARHSPKAYGYLKSKLFKKNHVDDVFQESFLRLHKFRTKYDPAFPFLPWFFTICRNAMVDYLRKVTREKEVISEITEPGAIVSVAHKTALEELSGLSRSEANVVNLHYLQGYSFNEVAEILKIKSSNARKISSRAIEKLRLFWK